eukprot:863751-Ditylum_brightwellii.AAC.1
MMCYQYYMHYKDTQNQEFFGQNTLKKFSPNSTLTLLHMNNASTVVSTKVKRFLCHQVDNFKVAGPTENIVRDIIQAIGGGDISHQR